MKRRTWQAGLREIFARAGVRRDRVPSRLARALTTANARKLVAELARPRDDRGVTALAEGFCRARLAMMDEAQKIDSITPATLSSRASRLFHFAVSGLAVHWDTLAEYDRVQTTGRH